MLEIHLRSDNVREPTWNVHMRFLPVSDWRQSALSKCRKKFVDTIFLLLLNNLPVKLIFKHSIVYIVTTHKWNKNNGFSVESWESLAFYRYLTHRHNKSRP